MVYQNARIYLQYPLYERHSYTSVSSTASLWPSRESPSAGRLLWRQPSSHGCFASSPYTTSWWTQRLLPHLRAALWKSAPCLGPSWPCWFQRRAEDRWLGPSSLGTASNSPPNSATPSLSICFRANAIELTCAVSTGIALVHKLTQDVTSFRCKVSAFFCSLSAFFASCLSVKGRAPLACALLQATQTYSLQVQNQRNVYSQMKSNSTHNAYIYIYYEFVNVSIYIYRYVYRFISSTISLQSSSASPSRYPSGSASNPTPTCPAPSLADLEAFLCLCPLERGAF